MGRNWTDTLAARRLGAAPGFGVPRDLDDRTRAELDDEAEYRGIDTEGLNKPDVVKAIRGA